MRLKQLAFSKSQKLPEATFYAEGLRLRPNYLVYTLNDQLDSMQREYLEEADIAWAEYPKTSPLYALIAFLKSVRGGLYLPEIHIDIEKEYLQLCVFLLDPHLIEAFEEKISRNRQGVLIRRPLLASHNFEEVIDIKEVE